MRRDFLPVAAHQLRRLYNKLLAQPCFLCGDITSATVLCTACHQDLPRLGPSCRQCALPLPSGETCGQCLRYPPIQHASYAIFRYQQPINSCITAFKFHQHLAFSHYFASQMSQQQQQRENLPDCLMPIPLHPRRIRHRGFNQSAELAKIIGQQLGLKVDLFQLKRIRHTLAQSDLSLKARKQNIKQAFQYRCIAPPESVALIDDVMTTGQTVSEASRCLLANGVKRVEVWTIARAIRHY